MDVTSSFEEMGKPVLSDEKNNKTTYVTLLGIEGSKKVVKDLSKEACEILETFGDKAEFLIELTKYLTERKK